MQLPEDLIFRVVTYLDYIRDADVLAVFGPDRWREREREWLRASRIERVTVGERTLHLVNGVVHSPDCDTPAETTRAELVWRRRGVVHRDGDLPAIVVEGIYRAWYRAGRLHRDGDRPATVYANGTREWYRLGALHRDDGPAQILAGEYGTALYYRNGIPLHTPNMENTRESRICSWFT